MRAEFYPVIIVLLVRRTGLALASKFTARRDETRLIAPLPDTVYRYGALERVAHTDTAIDPSGTLTILAIQTTTDSRCAPLWRRRPRAIYPRRIVAHVLGMATFKLRYPVALLILMKSDDFLFHDQPI
jgi:hypothetical protein